MSITSYPTVGKNKLVHTSLIRVTKTLRGTTLTGTIRVFSDGPHISGPGDTPGSYVIDDMGGHGSMGPRLEKHTTMLLFCRRLPATYAPPPPDITLPQADYRVAFELLGSTPFYRNDSLQSPGGGRFATQQAYYQYLADRYPGVLPVPKRKSAKRLAPTLNAPVQGSHD